MDDSCYEQVKENLIVEGLRDWISLREVHGDLVAAEAPQTPLAKVQKQTLQLIRQLVGDGLFILGTPSPTKADRAGFTPWDLPLDAAMARIEAAYVDNYDDRDSWYFMVWMDQTDKGRKLALQLYRADNPDGPWPAWASGD